MSGRLPAGRRPFGCVTPAWFKAGLHVELGEEVFQGATPVLTGVNAASAYCCLLAAEQRRDADTWGVHLLDAAAQGLRPDDTIADAGQSLRPAPFVPKRPLLDAVGNGALPAQLLLRAGAAAKRLGCRAQFNTAVFRCTWAGNEDLTMTPPDDSEVPPALKAFFQSAARPETRARLMVLAKMGYQQRSETELNLGRRLAEHRAGFQ